LSAAGLIGRAIDWSATTAGASTALIDNGDIAFHAARGSFDLILTQCKGA